ncbi:hypothetical protein ZWY2020_045188 [Hordeum vulgare]|nr:hypothetical protein ZWY2020_045188 [Hordeum vulgare]
MLRSSAVPRPLAAAAAAVPCPSSAAPLPIAAPPRCLLHRPARIFWAQVPRWLNTLVFTLRLSDSKLFQSPIAQELMKKHC